MRFELRGRSQTTFTKQDREVDLKCLLFVKRSYYGKCHLRGVGGQKKPKSCQRSLWTIPLKDSIQDCAAKVRLLILLYSKIYGPRRLVGNNEKDRKDIKLRVYVSQQRKKYALLKNRKSKKKILLDSEMNWICKVNLFVEAE